MRIVCYNILDGGEDRLPGILAVLRELRPDAAALVEANDRANAEWLAANLGMHLTFGEANNSYHIAWLTTEPPVTNHNHRHELLEKTFLEVEVDAEGRRIQLFAAHLAPHPHHEARRLEELQAIGQILERRAHAPHVLVGDFNALQPSPEVALIQRAGYTDCYAASHPANVDTRPVGDPTLRIDYIFASDAMAEQLTACDMRTGPDAMAASDHYAIWAEFAAT